MIFSSLNIKDALVRERLRQQKLMEEVHDLLENAVYEEEGIRQRIKKSSAGDAMHIAFNDIEQQNIFFLVEIRNICIRYRLRFLDASFYKHEIPHKAVLAIKDLERRYDTRIERFKIMAPDEAFNLESIHKDPILFAELSDGTYYLIHKWGNDLAWYKKYINLPLQSPVVFFTSLLVLCSFISILLPAQWMNIMNFTSEVYLKIWLSLHLFIMFTGLAIWAGMAFDKNFSCYSWNSKYYNG